MTKTPQKSSYNYYRGRITAYLEGKEKQTLKMAVSMANQYGLEAAELRALLEDARRRAYGDEAAIEARFQDLLGQLRQEGLLD